MAWKRFTNVACTIYRISRSSVQQQWRYATTSTTRYGRRPLVWTIARNTILSVGGSVALVAGGYALNHYCTVTAASVKNTEGLSRREQRFKDFASCELNDQLVMTPYDFIESLIENEPKIPRQNKVCLTEKDVTRIAEKTPSVEAGSTTFFRDLHLDGIITYSEYLFLVTILTKSNAGLKIALNMMDINNDKMINLEEFKLIERMISQSSSRRSSSSNSDGVVVVKEDEEEKDPTTTTLFIHLFGEDGQRNVSFEQFFRFMDNLQVEVLELEFHEHSMGTRFISEVDFACMLLRNTTLTEVEYSTYIDRVKRSIGVQRGVSLDQFKAFNTFLSNMDDFLIAVAMTNVSGEDLGKEFFGRAVHVVTGVSLDPYVIDIVFMLFDDDGNGRLSQDEFIGIMKDRLKRGFGKFPNPSGWRGFKHCLKKEMIKSAE